MLRNVFKRKDYSKVWAHPRQFLSRYYHVIFSRRMENAEVVVALFNRGLKKLRDSGRFRQMFIDSMRGMYEK
jgi:hypothetical protein